MQNKYRKKLVHLVHPTRMENPDIPAPEDQGSPFFLLLQLMPAQKLLELV
jgi:hypothetical protein